jgi:hypothetical protein
MEALSRPAFPTLKGKVAGPRPVLAVVALPPSRRAVSSERQLVSGLAGVLRRLRRPPCLALRGASLPPRSSVAKAKPSFPKPPNRSIRPQTAQKELAVGLECYRFAPLA